MSTSVSLDQPRPLWKDLLHPAVIVGALGYFVDIYDLVLFSIVRVPSLKALGLEGQALNRWLGIKPKLVTPDRARYSREHVGSPYIGWLHFQPIYDHLVATQPDMFE